MEPLDFTKLCEFLDVAETKSSSQVRQAFSNLFKHLRAQNEDLLLPLMRLLCIKMDRRRGPFNLGYDKIARCLIDALGIDKKSEQARKLLQYKQESTEFSTLVKEAIEARMENTDSHISLEAVHSFLDRIAAAEMEEKKTIFLELLFQLSAREMFWMVRIILKDLRIRVNGEVILSILSPKAKDLWVTNTDLQFVVNACIHGTTGTNDLKLGQSFKPMLCKRAETMEDAFAHAKELYVEEKLDGERVLLHRMGDRFKFYTKNYMDDTPRYGDKTSGPLTPFIHSQITPSYCILDGEMMAYKNGKPLAFGALRKFFGHHNPMTEHVSEEDIVGAQIKYQVFDILFIGEKDITGVQLTQRKELLRRVVMDNEYIEVVPHTKCASVEHLTEMLEQHIKRTKEGLVCKIPMSPYLCGSRGNEWVKVKKSTLTRIDGDFDVVIVGGYYGKGTRSGQLVSFLVGIVHDKLSMDLVYSSLAKVSALKAFELKVVQDAFDEYSIPCEPVEWLVHANKNKPDFLLNPQNSCIILEISGHEFIPSNGEYGFEQTIRFPVVIQLRSDKSIEDCECEDDLKSYIQANRMIRSEHQPIKAKPKASRKKELVINRIPSKRNVQVEKTLLESFSFQCDDLELESIIFGLGGDVGGGIVVDPPMEALLRQWYNTKKLTASPEQLDPITSVHHPLKLECGAYLFGDWSTQFWSIQPRLVDTTMVRKLQAVLDAAK